MKDEPILKVEQLKKYFPLGGGLFQRQRGFIKAVDGVDLSIRKGETLHILVHATAHDPRVSADQEFDVTRPRKMHFGFGGGAHHCLGQLVARTDMAAALTVMLRNWTALSWAGRPDYLPETGNTSPVHLPIRPEWTQVPA